MCEPLLLSGKCCIHLYVLRSCLMQRWASGQDAIDAIPRVPVLLPCSPDHSDAVVAPGGNTQNERPANSSDSPSEPTPGVATADAAVREPTHSAEPAQGGPVGRTAAGPRQAGKLVVDDDRGDKDGLPAGLRWVSPWVLNLHALHRACQLCKDGNSGVTSKSAHAVLSDSMCTCNTIASTCSQQVV